MASEAGKEKKVLDVNTLAIFLVKDHPGNKYVSPIVEEGLRGAFIPLVMDILPVRAYWIMTKKWGAQKRRVLKRLNILLKHMIARVIRVFKGRRFLKVLS